MAGFYLSNNQITAQNLKYIYGGPKPFLKLNSPRETKTFHLRCKEKEEERTETVRRRARRRFYERDARGEYLVPKAPAFYGVNHEVVDEIVNRLNRPKTSPTCHLARDRDREKKRVKTAKPRTERDLSNIFSRLHCQDTYMSRVRSSRGVRPPPPGRQSVLKRATSAPPDGISYSEIIKKWNIHV